MLKIRCVYHGVLVATGILFGMSSQVAKAQVANEITIKGTVVDETGKVLPNVSVSAGTQNPVTSTDQKGKL